MPGQMLENIQFKARSGAQITVDSAQGIVECFVAGIGNKDSVGDIVLPGAFTESLKRRKPRVVWGHSWNDPIGKVLEIYEVPSSDPRLPGKMKNAGIGGLFAKVQFNLGAEKGREAFANVAFFGEEQEWSIGYKTLQANFDPIKQANMLKEVELYEVSPVLHGANQLTGTISVKDGEVGACGANGCECGTKTTAMEPQAPEGVVFEKGFMMGRIPMVMIPLPMPKPEGDSSNAPSRDIWSRGEATPIDAEERLKLAQEIHGRTNVPIKIIEATENMVVFLRKMTDGTNRMYQMPYEKTDSGQYKFGRPARVRPQTVYTPDNTPKPPSPLGHIHHKPNVGPILGKGPATKDADSILVPCAIEDMLETKQFLEPILDFYNVQAVADREGLILIGGNPDFRDAADTAIKAIGRRIGGGLGKGRRAGRAIRRFDPDAWDGDNDGLVQEGTPWERPAIPGVNTNLPGMRHTIKKPKGLPKDTRDRDKPSKRPRRSPFLVPPERPQVGEEGRIIMPGERSGDLQPFDGSGRLEVRRAQAEAANRMPKDRGGMRSERNRRQRRLGEEFEGIPTEDLEAEINTLERMDSRLKGSPLRPLAFGARLRKLYEELELRGWDDLFNEERRSIPEGPDAAPDPIFNEKLRSKILEMIETERQRRADGLAPESWADRWLGGPDDPRGGMRSRLDRPRSKDQHPSGRPWMFGEKNPVIEERDRLKRGFWENSMERVTTDGLRTNRERRHDGMRSVWDGRRDGGLKPKEDPMTGREPPPPPKVDQAAVNRLESEIGALRRSKLEPIFNEIEEARKKGDMQKVHSLRKRVAEHQEKEAELRNKLGEAMGKGKLDLIRPGMRSSLTRPGKFDAFGPEARRYRSVGQTLGDDGNLNLLETELRRLDLLQERLSPKNWGPDNRRNTGADIDLIADMPPDDRDDLLGQIHWELEDVQTSWLKMTEQIDASYDWLADHDQEIDNFLEDMDQWGVGRWNVDYEVPPTLWGREQDQMWHKWAVSVFDDHVGPNWSRRGVTYMWNDDDQTYELYDHDKHFAEFGSPDEAWKEPLVGGMRFNDFLQHYKDQYQQTYGDEYNVRQYGIDNLRNWEKMREDAHNDSEWAVEVLEAFDISARIESESLSHQTIDDSGTRWENYKVRGGMRSAVNRPQATGPVTNRFLEYPEDHWDAEIIDGQAFQRPFPDFGPGNPQRHRGDGGNNPGEIHFDVLGGDHEGLTRVMVLDQRRSDLPADEGPNEMYLSNTHIVPSETVLLNEETGQLSFGGHTNRQASWHGMGMSGGKERGKQDGKVRNLDIGFELESWEMADVGDRPGDPIRRRDPDVGRKERLRFGVAPEPRARQAGERPPPGMRSQRDYVDRGGMRSRFGDASNRFNQNSAVTNLQELDDAAQGIQEFLDANPDFNPDEKRPPSDEAWWDQWTEYDDLRMEFDNLTEIFEGENYEHNASLQQVDSLEESLVQLNRDLDNDVFDLGMAVPADTDLQDIHELLKTNPDFNDRDGFMKLFTDEHIDDRFGDDRRLGEVLDWQTEVLDQWNRAQATLEDIAEHEQELYNANLDLEQTRERGEDGVWAQAQEISDAHYGRLLERNNRIQERSDNPVKPITDEELNEMAEYFGEDARSGGMRSGTSWRDINPDWDIRDPDDQSDWMESEMGPGQTAVGKISTDNVNVEIIPESDVLGDGDGFMVSGYYRDIDGVRGNEAEWFYDLEVFDTPEEAAAWVDSLDEAISNDIPYGDWERPKVDRDSAVPTDPSNENMNDIVGRLEGDTGSEVRSGMRSQRYDIRPDENGKWRVIDTANNNMPLPETYNTRERALRVAKAKDGPQGRGGMRYARGGSVKTDQFRKTLELMGFSTKQKGKAHEGWQPGKNVPWTIRGPAERRQVGGGLLLGNTKDTWNAKPHIRIELSGKKNKVEKPKVYAFNIAAVFHGWGMDFTDREILYGLVLQDGNAMLKALERLLIRGIPEVENGSIEKGDLPTVMEILSKLPYLHVNHPEIGKNRWEKLLAKIEEGSPDLIPAPPSLNQRFGNEHGRKMLRRTPWKLEDDQLEVVLNARDVDELIEQLNDAWDTGSDHPLLRMEERARENLLDLLDSKDPPPPPPPGGPPPGGFRSMRTRQPDAVPRTGMRTMSAQNRKQRRDEISEKLDVLNVGLRSALGDRDSDPAEVNRMLDTESRLRVERLELRQADTLASLESGSRSRIKAKKDLEMLLSDDEIGSLRTHLKGKIKATEDPDAKAAFATYDTLLANARGNKVKVPRATYDNIVNHWEAAVASDSRIHPKTGRDILEFAALDNNGKFTSPGMTRGSGEYSGFRSSRINNGAPPDITPRMQREMLDNWASRQEGRGRVGFKPPRSGGARSQGERGFGGATHGGQQIHPDDAGKGIGDLDVMDDIDIIEELERQGIDWSTASHGDPETEKAKEKVRGRKRPTIPMAERGGMPKGRGGMRSQGERGFGGATHGGQQIHPDDAGKGIGDLDVMDDIDIIEELERQGIDWSTASHGDPETEKAKEKVRGRKRPTIPMAERGGMPKGRGGMRSRRGAPQPFDGSGRPEVRAAQAAAANRMRGDHGLMLNAMREDKHGSPRQWQILRGQHGMRSTKPGSGPDEAPSDLPGAKPQRGRPVGTEIEDARSKGKTFAELKPDGWDEMSTQEKWDFLMADLGPESGMRRLDYDRLVKELGKKLDDEERRAARKRGEFPSLEERRARREAQGVGGGSRRREATVDRVSEPTVDRTTPEGAKEQRQNDLADLSDKVGRAYNAVEQAEQEGDADSTHTDVWAQVADVFDESDDLTFSQLERVDALLENYISGTQPAELRAAEMVSMENAQILKGRIENRLEHYRDNQFIQQGENLAATSLTEPDDVGDSYNMFSAGGMRSIKNNRDKFQTDTLQRYVEARRREVSRGRGRERIEEAAPRGGMRSRGGDRPERAEIKEKATFFRGIRDSLKVEIEKADRKQDRKTAAALKLLENIMRRQESARIGPKRTDAGTIAVTQDEIDQIMDGLMAVVDRQRGIEGSRTEMFAKLLEMFAIAAMSTFVEKSITEIGKRSARQNRRPA